MNVELTEDQKQTVKKWAKEGCGLQELQKKLSEEFRLNMTYMDVRFLAIDLGLEIRDKSFKPATAINAMATEEPESPPERLTSDDVRQSAGAPEPVAVKVGVDRVTRPGSVVSGTVKFSDGVAATWFLDQLGRLALNSNKPGYTPSPEDLEVFQEEIRKELGKMGF